MVWPLQIIAINFVNTLFWLENILGLIWRAILHHCLVENTILVLKLWLEVKLVLTVWERVLTGWFMSEDVLVQCWHCQNFYLSCVVIHFRFIHVERLFLGLEWGRFFLIFLGGGFFVGNYEFLVLQISAWVLLKLEFQIGFAYLNLGRTVVLDLDLVFVRMSVIFRAIWFLIYYFYWLYDVF
jgi:hypothetical protein